VPTDVQLASVDPEPGPLTLRLVGVVGVGGAVGSLARYGVAQWFPATTGFPWSTFAVNLVGSLILGVLLELLTRSGPDTGRLRQLRLLIGTGFCGGLTTYSTLAVEVDLLVRSHRHGLAAVYGISSVIGGLAIASLGLVLAARTNRRPA
jgi:CrcB protein